MSIKYFLERLRQRIFGRHAHLQGRQTGKLRVTRLEERKLLDASASLVGGSLLLQGFDALDQLIISDSASSAGGIDFSLSSGVWDTPIGPGLMLNSMGNILTLFPNSMTDLTIDAVTVPGPGLGPLASITAIDALQLSSLTINGGGDVTLANAGNDIDEVSVQANSLALVDSDDIQLDSLTVVEDVSVTATSITDDTDVVISVGGNAAFTGTNVTLGDDLNDQIDFGSLTFVATGAVDISEDSATTLKGDNDAASLTLVSGGPLDSDVATSLDVTGHTSLEAASIALDNSGGRSADLGSLEFSASGDVAITESSGMNLTGNSSGTNIALSVSDGDVTIAADVIASGDIDILAGGVEHTLTLSAGATIDTSGVDEEIILTADNMTLASSGSIGADGDTVVLQTATVGTAIGIGTGATDAANKLTLDQTELDALDGVAELHIGAVDNTGGAVTVEGNTALATDIETGASPDVVELWLHSSADVAGMGELTVSSLAVVSGGSVNLSALDVENLAAQVTGSVSLTNAAGTGLLNVTTIAADADLGAMPASVSGVSSTNGGDISVAADAIQQSGNISTSLTGSVALTAVSGTISMVDGVVTSTGSGTIQYDASANVILSRLVTAGDVTLNATTGAIADNLSGERAGNENVVASLLTATAGGDIGGAADLDTAIDALNVSSLGPGTIAIAETDGVDLVDVDTANGAITVTAGGPMTVSDVQSLTDTDANDIVLTTTVGQMNVVSVSAGASGDVTLNSAAAISDDGVNGTRVAADLLTVTASGSVTLGTEVTQLAVGTVAAGDVVVEELNALTLTAISTADGGVDVTAGGLLNALNVAASGAGHDVILSTTAGGVTALLVSANDTVVIDADVGNVSIGQLSASSSVSVTADTGTINDSSIDSVTDITAASISLLAAGGIGQSAGLELAGTTISLVNTVSGDIQATNSAVSAVNVTNLTTAGGGAVSFQNFGAGGVTFGTVTTVTDGSPAAAEDSISLGSSGGDLTVATAVDAGGMGDVVLTATAGGNVIITGSVSAIGDSVSINSSGSVNGTGIVTASGVDIDAVTGVGTVAAIQTGAEVIDVMSVSGDVEIANSLAAAVTVTGLATGNGQLTFSQSGGGTATFTGSVSSGNLVPGGDILLSSTAGLAISATASVSSATGTGGTLSASGADISGGVNVGAGNITISGANADLVVNSTIVSSSTVELTAQRDIIIGALIDVDGGGDIILTADSNLGADTLSGGHGGVRILAAGKLDAQGGVAITGSDLFSTAVTLDSILIDSDGTNDQVVAAGHLSLTGSANAPAGSSVVVNGRVSSSGATSTISVSAAGDVDIGADGRLSNAMGAISITSDSGPGNNDGQIVMVDGAEVISTAGQIILHADGNIHVGHVNTASGVSLTSESGMIVDAGDIHVDITAASLAINASVGIGTLDAIDVSAATIIADTTTGNVGLDSQAGGNVAVLSAKTLDGDVLIDQTGNFSLTLTDISTVDGSVRVSNSGATADIVVASVRADTVDGVVVLTAGGAIIDADNDLDITAFSSALRATAGIGSAGAFGAIETAVTRIAFLNTAANSVQLGNTGSLTIADVDGLSTSSNAGGDIALTATSPVVFAADTSALGALTVQALESGVINFDNITVNGGVTVESTGADIVFEAGDRISIAASAVVRAMAAGGDVTFRSGMADTDLDGSILLEGAVTANSSDGIVTLDVNGQQGVLQTALGTIGGSQLQLLGVGASGEFDLGQSMSNDVGVLAADVDGAIEFRDANGLQIGTAGVTSGITTSNDNVTICAASITLAAATSVGTGISGGTVRLQAFAGAISQTAGAVTATLLGARASSGVSLNQAGNNVGSVAIDSGTGAVLLVNASGFDVTAISADGCFSTSVTGITSGGDVEFCALTGDIDLLAAVSATGGTVRIQADSGNVTQDAFGVVTATSLGVRASGQIDLDESVHQIFGVFAATSTTAGDVAFRDTGGFSVGSISAGSCFGPGVVGVNTTLGSVSLSADGGTLLNSAGISAVGGNVFVSTTGSGDIELSGTVSAAGNSVILNSVNSINGAGLVSADTVDLDAVSGIGNTTALELTGVSLLSADNSGVGRIELNHAATSGLNVSSLVTASGIVSFDQSGNQGLTLNVVATGDGDIVVSNTGGVGSNVQVGSIVADSVDDTVSIEADGAINDAATDAVGDIAAANASLVAAVGVGNTAALETNVQSLNVLNLTSGSVVLSEADDLIITLVDNGTRNVTIAAGGSITDGNGAGVSNIVAGLFTADAAGQIALDTDVAVLDLSTSAAGNIDVRELNAIELLDVSTSDGAITIVAGGTMTATNVTSSATDNDFNDISLTTTSGHIELGLIDAGSLNDVRLAAAGAILELAPGDVAADVIAGDAELSASSGIGSAGAIETTLSNLAFYNSTSGNVQIVNSQVLSLTNVGGTLQSQNSGGDITICVQSGDLMVQAPLLAVGSTIRLQADAGGVIQTATGVIAAQHLGVHAHGDILLDAASGGNDIAAVFGAESASGQVRFANRNGYSVGAVLSHDCFAGVAGIGTAGNDVKLSVDGDLDLDNSISIGAANLLLSVTGKLSQQAGASIVANGLALMVDGTTTLSDAGNDITVFAAACNGQVLFRDADALTVGSVTVGGMLVTGITTSNDDVKLTVDTNGLNIDDAVNLATGNLLLNVAGNIIQQSGDSISASGLAIMADGQVALADMSNNVAHFAATVTSDVSFVDADTLNIGDITVDGMQVVGVTTTDGSVAIKVNTGNLVNSDNVEAGGTGDVVLTASAGSVVLTGTTTASDDAVTINSAVAINGAGTVAASFVELNAVNGIGNTIAVQLADVEMLSADNSGSGNIDLDHTATGTLVVTSLTTVAGTVNFDQTGDQSLRLDVVATNAGDVTITSVGGINADLMLGRISSDSTISLMSDGAVVDNNAVDVNLVAVNAVIVAVEGVGSDSDKIETALGVIAVETESGDIGIVDSDSLQIGTVGTVAGLVILDALADDSTLDNIMVSTSGFLVVDAMAIVANHDGGSIMLVAANGLIDSGDIVLLSDVSITGGDAVDDADGNITAIADAGLLVGAGISVSTDDTLFASDAGNVLLQGMGPVRADIASTISTDEGAITISGNAGGAFTGAFAGVLLDSATVVSDGGSISVTGFGGTHASGNNDGIELNDSLIQTASGMITLTGTGGAGDNSEGIEAEFSTISSSTGHILLTGTGGAAGFGNSGINIDNFSFVESTGTGSITLDGTGGAIGSDSRGVDVQDFATVTSVDGDIVITGLGGADGDFNAGIDVSSDALVQSTGAATITLNGTGGSSGSENDGVFIRDAGTVRSSTGAIQIVGTGGMTGDFLNTGVSLFSGGIVESLNSATVTISGTGGGAADASFGVLVEGDGSKITAVDGAIDINGIGGGTAGGVDNVGVLILDDADVVATGTGTIHIVGTGTTGAGDDGVAIDGIGTTIGTVGGIIRIDGTSAMAEGVEISTSAVVMSMTGNIEVSGTGGVNGNAGIHVHSQGAVSSTGTATVTLWGTAGTSTHAVQIGDAMSGAGSVTSAGGAISVSGTGATGNGIHIVNGSVVTGIGTATVELNSDNRIVVDNSAVSADASVTLHTDDNVGSGDDIDIRNSSLVGSAASTVRIAAGDSILLRTGSGTASAGTLTLVANNASTDSVGAITMEDGTTVSALGGSLIDVDATQDITLGALATAGEVQVTSWAGAIIDGGDSGVDITAGQTVLRAVTGIGQSGGFAELDLDVSTLAFMNSGTGDVNISNAGHLSIDTVDGLTSSSNAGGGVSIIASGTVTFVHSLTSSGDITVDALESAVDNRENIVAAAGVTIRSASGDIVLRAGDRISIADSAIVRANDTGAQNILLASGFGNTDTDGQMALHGQLLAGMSSGRITLDLGDSGGAVQDATGQFCADELLLLSFGAAGTFDLDQTADNLVSTVAAEADGEIEFLNSGSLVIGSIGTVNGIGTSDDDVTLCATSISLVMSVAVGSATLRLSASTGSVTQTGGQVTASGLGSRAATGIDLSSATNDVDLIAADGGSGTVTFADIDGFSVGTVSSDGCFTIVTGIAAGGDLEVCAATGDIQLTTALTVGGTIRMEAADGSISQTAAGTITATDAGLRAMGDIDLDATSNDIANAFAAVSTGNGAIAFLDNGGFTVGTVSAGSCVNAVSGVATTNGGISLMSDGGDLVNAAGVSAGGVGDVAISTMASGSIVLTGTTTADGNAVTLNSVSDVTGGGLVTAQSADIDAGTGIGATALQLAAANIAADTVVGDIDIDNALANPVTVTSLTTSVGRIRFDQSGGGTLSVTFAQTTDGDVRVSNRDADLNADTFTAGGVGNVYLTTTVSGSVFVNDVTADGDDITISSAAAIEELTVTDMAADLTSSTLHLTATTGIGEIQTIETAVDVVTFVNLAGNVRIQNAGSLSVADSFSGGDVELCLTTGDLLVDGELLATGTTVRLQANAGSVTESALGRIVADNLGVRAESNITLGQMTNVVAGAFAADSTTGSIAFRNLVTINVDSVSSGACMAAVAGVTTTSGDITLDNQPNLQAIVVFEAVSSLTGDIDIDSMHVENFAAISSDSGHIDITASSVVQESLIETGNTGTVTVTADQIQMGAGITTTDSGSISYDAVTEVGLNRLISASGNITVTASAGRILDFSTGNELSNLATTGTVTLTAANGIGESGVGNVRDIDTDAGSIQATNTVVGDILIHETDGLLIVGTGVQTLGGDGNVDIDVDAGSLVVNAGVTAHGAGAVSLNADNGGVETNAIVSSSTGGISISADQITQNADVTTGGAAAISLTADVGAVTMFDGTTTSNDTGVISVVAISDISLSRLQSNGGVGTVEVVSSAGAILDNLTGDGSGNENIIADVVSLQAATGIGAGGPAAIDTLANVLNAHVTAPGDVFLSETDSVLFTSTTTDGSITLIAHGTITANQIDAGGGTSDSVSLATTTGGINAEDVTAADSVFLNADSGNVTITEVTALGGNVEIAASAGDVLVFRIAANAAGAVVDITASGSVLDRFSDTVVNISATAGNVIIDAGADIGEAGTDVLKNIASDPIEMDSAFMRLTATGIIAVHQTSSTVVTALNVGTGTAFLSTSADLDLSPATPVAANVALLATGQIVLPATVNQVSGDLRVEAADVDAAGGMIDLNATRILFKSGQSEEINVTAERLDAQSAGDLTINTDSTALILTDLDCDLTALDVGINNAVLNSTVAALVTQELPSDGDQNSRILAGSLVLNGQGTFELTNGDNDTDVLAGSNVGSIAYKDLNDVTIDAVHVVTGTPMLVAGLYTGNSDVLLDVGTTLHVTQPLNAGSATVRIASRGSQTQASAGAITAGSLGLHQQGMSGDIQFAADNAVNTLAARNDAAAGTITFSDIDDLLVDAVGPASVADAAFSGVIGLNTVNGDVNLEAGGSLMVAKAISVGTGDVRMFANGDISQTASGNISAVELGVRQQSAAGGNIVLDDLNAVDVLAVFNASDGGQIAFRNTMDLIVDTVAAVNIPALPGTHAFNFMQTDGVLSTDGDILLKVDGSLLLNQQVSAGSGDVRILTEGDLSQSATGQVTADQLGIRQRAAAGNIRLGDADNDVNVFSAINDAYGSVISLFDLDDLIVGEVGSQSIGLLDFVATVGIDTNAGDINITTTDDLTITRNVDAVDAMPFTGGPHPSESIILNSRSGDIRVTGGTALTPILITTDEDPTPGAFMDATDDAITIVAGGTVDLGDPAGIEIRTDAGVAKRITPRPTAFSLPPTMQAENAFVTLVDAENMRSSLTFELGGFLGIVDLFFGTLGEENLEVVIDWGVVSQTSLTSSGPAGDAVPSGAFPGGFEFSLDDADKTIFYIDEGGRQYLIPHIYAIADLATSPNDRNGRQNNPNIIGVRFSVSQHESINIWGQSAAVQGAGAGTPPEVPPAFNHAGTSFDFTDATGTVVQVENLNLALLSSTDTNPLRDFTQEAAETPFGPRTPTPTGIPEGLAEWEFIAGPSPGIVPSESPERPTIDIDPIEAVVETGVFSEVTTDVSFGAGAASEAAVGTDVYLQIRRQFELDADPEVVIARITDDSFIANRDQFEEFVKENPDLTDGAGYEVWLITETDGQTVERPIVRFEITGGRPGPATEELPDTFEPYRLKELQFEQPSSGGNGSEAAPSEADSDLPEMPMSDQRQARQPDATGDAANDRGVVPEKEDGRSESANDPDNGRGDSEAKPGGTNESEQTDNTSDGQAGDSNVSAGMSLLAPALTFGVAARWRRRHSETRISLTRTARTLRKMDATAVDSRNDGERDDG